MGWLIKLWPLVLGAVLLLGGWGLLKSAISAHREAASLEIERDVARANEMYTLESTRALGRSEVGRQQKAEELRKQHDEKATQLAKADSDGCLDRSLPDDLRLSIGDAGGGETGSPAKPDGKSGAAVQGKNLPGSRGVHPAPTGVRGSVRSGQASGSGGAGQ